MLKENHFKLIYNNIADLVFLVEVEADNGYRFLSANKSYLAATGYTEEQVVGKRVEEIYPKAVSCLLIQKFEQAIELEKTICFEEIADFPKGKLKLEIKITPICDGKGYCTHLLWIANGNTEWKQFEDALWQAQAEYSLLLEQMPGIIYIADIDNARSTTYISPQVGPILGFSPNEMKDNPELWARQIHPDDRQRVLDELRQSHTNGEQFRSEYRMVASDSRVVWIHDEATMVRDENNRPCFIQGIMLDITERKKFEKQVELERQQLISVFDGIDESIYVSDPDTYEILYANRSVKDMFGDIIGKKCYQALQGMESPCPFCSNEYIFKQNAGKSYIREFHNKINHRWYRCIDRAIRWPDGRTVRFEMAIDITGFKQAVDALRVSEEKFRLLFDKANDAIGLFEITAEGLPGRIIEINDVACRRLGYSREELLGMNSFEIIHLEDNILAPKNMQKIIENKGCITFEATEVTKNGKTVPVEASMHIFYLDGKKVGLVIARDITERKLRAKVLQDQNEFLQKMADTVPIPIFYKDAKGIYIGCNTSFESFTGLTRDEITGKSVYELNLENADIYCEKDMELFNNRGVQVYESTVRYADGSVHNVIFNKATFSDSDGNVAGLVGAIVDITEQKKMEETIKYRIALEGSIAQSSRLFVSPECVDPNKVLKILGESVSANRAYIFRFRENGSKMDNVYEWCSPGTAPQIDNLQDLDSSIFPWWLEKLERGENIVISDVDALPAIAAAEKEILEAQEIRSLLVVPICSTDGKLNGFMGFDDTEKCREWSGEDVKALRVVAEMVGVYWERQRAEEALQETNQLLQQIIESLPDATLVIDRNKKIIAWNRAIEEMTGVSKEAIIGKDDYAYAVPFYGSKRPILIDLIFSENRDNEQLYAFVERKGKALYTESFAPALYKGKGAYQWATASPLFDSEDNIIGAIESIRDITERKRMEERLQYLATQERASNFAWQIHPCGGAFWLDASN